MARLIFNRNLFIFFSIILLLSNSGCKKEETINNTNKDWETVGSININKFPLTLCSDPSGNIYVAGFTDGNNQYYVLKWNGSAWSILGNLRSNSAIYYLSSDLNGNIYASGQLVDNADTYYYVAKWDGSSWTDLGLHDPYGGNMLITVTDRVGALYATSSSGPGDNVYAYIGGSSWSNLGSIDPNNSITTIASDGAGKVYEVLYSNSLYPPVVAVYNGGWTQLPQVTAEYSNNAKTSCITPNGDFYMGGNLYDKIGKSFYVAKWNGSSWTKLGGLSGEIESICTDNQGNLYAAGSLFGGSNREGFDVMKWDGTKWIALGSLDSKLNIHAICSDPTGNIYAEGHFGSSYSIKKYKK